MYVSTAYSTGFVIRTVFSALNASVLEIVTNFFLYIFIKCNARETLSDACNIQLLPKAICVGMCLNWYAANKVLDIQWSGAWLLVLLNKFSLQVVITIL